MNRAIRTKRADYRHFLAIPTRWSDNDAYAHVNNVVYYSWFDTVVNRWLVENGLLDIAASPVVSLVVETGCNYFESVAFPDTVHAGLAVERLGSSSIVYAIGIFREGSDDAAAQGRFVHVTVDRATQRPVPIPTHARQAAGLGALAPRSAGSPLVSTPRGPVVTIQTPAEDHGRSREFAQPHRLAEKTTACMRRPDRHADSPASPRGSARRSAGWS